jgi:hypothetical protein
LLQSIICVSINDYLLCKFFFLVNFSKFFFFKDLYF